MREAITNLGKESGRKVAVLGDMLELGDKAVDCPKLISWLWNPSSDFKEEKTAKREASVNVKLF